MACFELSEHFASASLSTALLISVLAFSSTCGLSSAESHICEVSNIDKAHIRRSVNAIASKLVHINPL